MNIAIAGAGVAGSYLGHLLQKRGHNVEIFESSNRKNHWPTHQAAASSRPRNAGRVRSRSARFSSCAGRSAGWALPSLLAARAA